MELCDRKTAMVEVTNVFRNPLSYCSGVRSRWPVVFVAAIPGNGKSRFLEACAEEEAAASVCVLVTFNHLSRMVVDHDLAPRVRVALRLLWRYG